MAEHCKYLDEDNKRGCPMGGGIIEIADFPCTRGENGYETCGGVAAMLTLHHNFGDLTDFDLRNPVQGNFKIHSVPASEHVPENIREMWIGCELPIRFTDDMQDSGLIVMSSADVLLSLISKGRFEAVDWFSNGGRDMVDFSRAHERKWVFQMDCGSIEPSDKTSSRDFYGTFLPKDTLRAVEATF